MTNREIQSYRNRMHHFAKFYMQDGSTVEGNMQPFDDEYVYLTLEGGKSGGKLKISEIQRIEFPND